LLPQTLYTLEKVTEIELLGKELGFDLKCPQRGRKKEIINLAEANARQT
jgi:excinuclease UvrABC nuclease subunit